MDRPRFSEHLEAIKFICKDFWSELFKKQIDNLKTNHRVDLETCNSEHLNFEIRNALISCAYPSLQGTFVLQDNHFRWLKRISIDSSAKSIDVPQQNSSTPGPDSKGAQAASMHLYFPCGIIKEALSNLGIPCAVSADISNLPACSFVTRIKA